MKRLCRIELFGGLQVQQDERTISRFRTQRTAALLAYLSYHRQQLHPRETLIDLLWPESTIEAGRHSLSMALSSLRHQLEPPGFPAGAIIIADRQNIRLNLAAVTTDVADFETTLHAANRATRRIDQERALVRALDLYQGQLLPGLYDAWIAPEQERLAQRFQQAVHQLIALLVQSGESARAIEYARRAVQGDPLREDARVDLISLLSEAGQPVAALREYLEWERFLKSELDEPPAAATRVLAGQIAAKVPTDRDASSQPPLPLAGPLPTPAPLPTGTVTLLLIDMEGPAPPLRTLEGPDNRPLTKQRDIIHRQIRAHGGSQIEGRDGVSLAAFATAGAALACAVACRQALRELMDPDIVGTRKSFPLEIRMAVVTGDMKAKNGQYQGPILSWAHDLLAAAHRDQTLCSDATAALLRRDLQHGIQLTDLGLYRLDDGGASERIFQLDYPGQNQTAFPPLKAGRTHVGGLPLSFTRFFGREAEIVMLTTLLTGEQTRLVTLTGPGGTGKTRLALEVARRMVTPLSGAIWFVALAALADPDLLVGAIADNLGLARRQDVEPLDQILEALAKQSSLLVLDNFEQLVDGGVQVVQTLLERLPMVTCLVTSRQILGLSSETEFVVPFLPTPNGSDTPETLSTFESVQLFIDRAQAVRPDFQVTNNNAPAVAELCDRLEGIPLALELAAARAQALTPAQMLSQLSARFDFLVSRKRDVAERHRTLRTAMDWSYRLLSPRLQLFFRSLSAFRGGCTYEAAETVCGEPIALDLLAQLRECSLVSITEEANGMRFRMLESLREYAEERLSVQEATNLEQRHALFFTEAIERYFNDPALKLFPYALAEHDNVRAALRWCQAASDGIEMSMRLAGRLWQFWWHYGHWNEARLYLGLALQRDTTSVTAIRAQTLEAAGNFACYVGKPEEAEAYYEQKLKISRQLEDGPGIASALHSLGFAALHRQDWGRARDFGEQSLAMFRELQSRPQIAGSLNNLGDAAVMAGEYLAATAYYQESLKSFQELGNQSGVALNLYSLAEISRLQQDFAQARELCEASLVIYRRDNARPRIPEALEKLAMIAEDQQDFARASALRRESKALYAELKEA